MDILQVIHHQLDEYLHKTSLLLTDLDTPFSKFSAVNVVPGPQDIPLIDAIVSERNTQISTLALQMANIATAIQKLSVVEIQLEEHSTRVRESLVAHRALTSPARRIPPEILGEIFYHCLPKTPYITPRDVESPMVLARVCRHWRDIAMSTPRLWSSLSIYLQKTTFDAYRCGCESWLSRAKSVPLTLRVLNDINPFTAEPLLLSVAQWLQQLIGRSGDLWWHGPSLPAFFLPETRADLPIQSLHVTTHREMPSVHLPGLATSLRSASIQCLNYDLQSLEGIDLPWSTLVELNLHFGLIGSPLFVQLLAQCGNLRTLIVSCLSADDEQVRALRTLTPGAVTHHRLRRVEIKVIRAGLDAMFSALTLPALEDLDVCFCHRERDPWPHGAFMEMVGRSRCAMKRLTVRSNKGAMPYFGDYMSAMPGLAVYTSAVGSRSL